MLTHRNVLISVAILCILILLGVAYFDLSGWWMIAPILVYLGFASYGSASIQASFYIYSYSKGKTETKQIALTFDDGPVDPYTSEVLDILKTEEIKATFFCIGKQIEKHPQIFKRIIEEGHTLGNHTYSHSYQMGFFPKSKVLKEINETDKVILAQTDKNIKWFRPPFGVTNPMISNAIKQSGHQVIGWSIRSLDTVIRDETKVAERIEKQLHPGSVVLLHDRLPEAGDILKKLLVVLKKNEYEVVELEKLLNLSPYKA